MAKFEYYDESLKGSPEIVEFPDEMVEIIERMKAFFPEVAMEDMPSDWHKYDGTTPTVVSSDKKSLKFGINCSKTRVGREAGEKLYVVTVSEFNQ